jgi:ankyrin repeat protein
MEKPNRNAGGAAHSEIAVIGANATAARVNCAPELFSKPRMKRLTTLLCLLCQLSLLPTLAQAELPDPTLFSIRLELGDVDKARAWLDEGLDPNFEGAMIGTGLMIGAWEGNIPLMELFLSRGANINQTNRFGEQALMLAAWKNRPAAMQWLLAHGAQANRVTDHEWTALHYATFAGNGELIDPLVRAGANINARSTNGSSVLMMAAREGHGEIAKQLVGAGANPALKNDNDEDAIAWAMRQGNYEIAKSFTSAENFAELARQAALNPSRPTRSLAAPDKVEEMLRMARLAEARGKRGEALTAYRKALAELKALESAQKVGAGGTAKKSAPGTPPSALVIQAKRGQPDQQVAAFKYAVSDEQKIDQLLEQARAAEAAGRTAEAIKLFRQASARIKAGQ